MPIKDGNKMDIYVSYYYQGHVSLNLIAVDLAILLGLNNATLEVRRICHALSVSSNSKWEYRVDA